VSIVPNQPSRSGDGCFIEFGPGTFSVGYLHPQVECIVPGFYRGDPLTPHNTTSFWRLHNGPSDDDQVVKRNDGPFPIYVHIADANFFTSKYTRWTRLEDA